MTISAQNIDAAYGLNKDARLKAQATESAIRTSPGLDPDYPFFVLPFNPGFYGTPRGITNADILEAQA